MIDVHKLRQGFDQAGALAERMVLHSFIGENTFLTSPGDVGVVLEAGTLDLRCRDDHELDDITRRINKAISALPPGFRVYQYLEKRHALVPPPATSVNNAVSAFESNRHQWLSTSPEPAFLVEGHIALICERESAGQDRFHRVAQSALKFAGRFSERRESASVLSEIHELSAIAQRAARALIEQLADVLSLRILGKDEAFRFFYTQLNPGSAAYPQALQADGLLALQLAGSPVECHDNYLIVGDRFVQVLTLKALPHQTHSSLLHKVLQVPAEFTVATEWKPFPAEQTRSLVGSKKRFENFMKSSLSGLVFSSAKSNPQDTLRDGANAASVEELGEVERVVAQGHSMGEFSLSVAVYGGTEQALRQSVNEMVRFFSSIGASVICERYYLFDAWLAMMPGNAAYNLRRMWLLDTTYGDLSLLMMPATGAPEARK